MKSLLVIKRRELVDKDFFRFLLPLFFILLADSLLSYAFPVIINEKIGSSFALGIIMAASSVVGVGMDLLIPRYLNNRGWKTYLFVAIAISFLYPIFILIGDVFMPVLFFLFGSIVWGIYFEFISFAEQGYIIDEEPVKDVSTDWGIVYVLWQIGSLISPIIGAVLISISVLYFSLTVVFIQTIALLLFYLAIVKYKNDTNKKRKLKSHTHISIKLMKEISLLKLLTSKLFLVLLTSISANMIIALFWTVGGVMGEQLTGHESTSWIALFVFNLAILAGTVFLIINPINKNKEEITFALILSSSLLMSIFLFTNDINILFGLIFGLSISAAISVPLNESIFSDIAKRDDELELFITSLSRIGISFAYVMGPISAGVLGEFMSYKDVVGVFGVVTLIPLTYIYFHRKKIRLPKKQLREFLKES